MAGDSGTRGDIGRGVDVSRRPLDSTVLSACMTCNIGSGETVLKRDERRGEDEVRDRGGDGERGESRKVADGGEDNIDDGRGEGREGEEGKGVDGRGIGNTTERGKVGEGDGNDDDDDDDIRPYLSISSFSFFS